MSKKSAEELIRKMEIDMESLLSDDSEKHVFSPEKSSKGRKKMKYSKTAKDEKPRRGKQTKEPEEEEEEEDESLDISTAVQNFKNDVGKPIKAKKAMLDEFTRQVLQIYQTKTTQLLRRQASEEKELRTKFMNEVDKELEKWKEDMNKVTEEEEKIVQMLQKHLKIMEKAKNSSCLRKKNVLKIAKSFEEQKEELVGKHEIEISESLESAKNDISELQTKVISDIQKEEMASMKRLFCSQMFF